MCQNFQQISKQPIELLSIQHVLESQMLRVCVNGKMKWLSSIWNLNEQQLCKELHEYQNLPNSRVHPDELFKIQQVRLIRSDNKIYLGQISNKKKHGQGLALYQDGRIYQGQFQSNDKHGYGCQIYPNGNLYTGGFYQNKKHGKGNFYWFNLCEERDKGNDKQTIEQYHGDWWGGLPDGYGEHLKNNGDYYQGEFKNGLKHGEGMEKYANGDIYKGEFINGLPEGYGEYMWNDQAHYRGDFKQGYRNGYGVWFHAPPIPENYKGHYVLDKKQGYGIYNWGNGYVYKGNFTQDLRSGQGELLLNNKTVFKGYWQNGQQSDGISKVNPEQKIIQNDGNETDLSKYESEKKQYDIHGHSSGCYISKLNKTQITEKKRSQQKMKIQNKHTHHQPFVDTMYPSRIGHKNCIPCEMFGRRPRPASHWQSCKKTSGSRGSKQKKKK